MPDISILPFVRAVHSTTLLGAAKKLGVNPPPPPILVRNLFNTRPFDSGYLTTNQPFGGSIKIVLDNSHGDGEATIFGSFHNSGADNIDYTVTAVLVTPGFRAFTYQHSGHTEGTSGGLLSLRAPHRDDNFVIPTASNPLVAQNWSDVFGATLTADVAPTDTLVQGVEAELGRVLDAALVAAGQTLGKAGATAVIALL